MSRSASASVIVITHNEGENLRLTVSELLATLPATAEVIVVDDRSSDGSVELLDPEPRLRVVRPTTRLGISRSRNYGAAHATGELVVFCDAHMAFEADWLAPLTEVLARPEVGAASLAVSAVGAPQCKGYGITWKDCLMNVEWLGSSAVAPAPVPMICGCFVAMRREVFAECGGFDDGLVLWGFEDAELSLRLWTSGYQCVVVPQREVQHLFRERFPYELEPWITVHNLLRVAIVHLAEHRIERVLSTLAGNAALPPALTRVIGSDVWARRDAVRARRRFDDSWFLERFGITAFDG